MKPNQTIIDGTNYIPQAKALVMEYAERLGRDLSFQNIEAELEDLSVKYTPPEGEILVAIDENKRVLGMVAYHRHDAKRCEMKRLYVKPESRGLHLGEALVGKIIARAKIAGYQEMVLDTIVPFQAAIGIYKKYGFVECEPYYDNPMDDVIYMVKQL